MIDRLVINRTSTLMSLSFVIGCVQLSCATNPTPKNTDLLQPVEGYTGELIGAEVTRVNPMPNDNMVEIIILVPKNAGEIKTVDIVDKQDRKVETAKAFEFNKGADGEPNGVIIYPKNPLRLPFRLKFNAEKSE